MTTTTYDPVSTAQSLATAYTSGRQALIKTQTTTAESTATALTKLQSALMAFDSALTSLSNKKSVLSQLATFSASDIGTATASPAAVPGTYSFFVEQLASADQVAYSSLTNATVTGGINSLTVNLAGGGSFSVDLNAADIDGNGVLTAKEIAGAVNSAAGNDSSVTASSITVNGESQLVLTSTASGAAGAISLDTSAIDPANTALIGALSAGNNLVVGKDAIVWLGDKGTGVKMQQSSNTFTAIDGVSMTFTRAMANGEAPVTMTVARDDSGTAANVQSFVDAYNALHAVLNSLTYAGDPASNVAASIFANDSGVLSLQNSINSTLRESVGGLSLTSFGITANRDGSLSLNSTRLKAKLASNPDGLETVFGSSALGARSGVMGDLDRYLDVWTSSAGGQLTQRQTAASKQKASLATQQDVLDSQYNSAYSRYLAQFTQLQSLQAQMEQTTNLFDALFSSEK